MVTSGSWLSWFLRGVLVLLFILLVGRLIDLQIIKGAYYRELSNGNRIRRVVLPAPRGKILARGGEVLVGNIPVNKRIVFKPQGGFDFSDNTSGAPDDEILILYRRNYVLGSEFAHAGGYLGEANSDEVGKIDPKCPQEGPRLLGDFVGRSGMEEEYDCLLRGKQGEELVEVDIMGKVVRVLGRQEPVSGSDLKTNIDVNLQTKVAQSLENKKGAAVVTDTKGEILAFASSPSFDPNLFVNEGNETKIAKLLSDPALPLFNRAVGGLFHPGSVFKPVVALAALSEGVIDKNFVFSDTGVIKVGTYSYTNWYFTQYGRTEGEIGITRAIARSTDTFFYKVGEMVGIDGIDKYADKFGLSKLTGIDIPGEVLGLIPTPQWKKKTTGEDWFLGNTYHVAIGQGDVSVTPIEINTMISAIAANGFYCQPRFVGDGKCSNLGLRQENIDIVKKGMTGACSEGGTGYTFFDFAQKYSGQTVACKTGTAETNEDGKTHAWFTLMVPANIPEMVTTVLFERGGEGATVAGPVARRIVDDWELEKNP